MPADTWREPPPPGTRHGHGRPPDGPPEDQGWAIARHVSKIFGWPPFQAAPALPPLTASGLRAHNGLEHEDGAVQRPLEISSGGSPPNAKISGNLPYSFIVLH